MRARHLTATAVVLAVAAAALFGVSSAGARQAQVLDNPVKITNRTCTVGYPNVGHVYTTVVFPVFNNGTVPHRFFIGGPYHTLWIQPGQEETVITYFHPGHWKWACVSHRKVVARGVFTIRP